jgi:hypothetical protein
MWLTLFSGLLQMVSEPSGIVRSCGIEALHDVALHDVALHDVALTRTSTNGIRATR